VTRPESIGAFFVRARRREAFGRLARAASVGASSAAVVAAAIELDGGDALGAQALVAATACAVLGAWLAWSETGLDDAELARRLDRRLEQHGALSTALEVERSAPSVFSSLLAARAADALPHDALARATPKPSLAWLAAPLFALGLWLVVSQARAPRRLEVAELAARAEAALAGAGSSDAAAARATAQELERLARDARTGDETLQEHVQQLSEQLANVFADPTTPDALRWELAASRAELEGAAARLNAEQIADASKRGRSREGLSGAPKASTTLQIQADDRTMKGSTSDESRPNNLAGAPRANDPTSPGRSSASADASSAPGASAGATPEVGVAAGRWWPREYDDVVAAWRGRAR